MLIRYPLALKYKPGFANSLLRHVKTWLAALELHHDKYRDKAASLGEATHSVWPQVKFFGNLCPEP